MSTDIHLFSRNIPPPAPTLFLLLPTLSLAGVDSFSTLPPSRDSVAPSISFIEGKAGVQSGSSASLVHCGQNHSPSGTSVRGGDRHPRWYGLSHYENRVSVDIARYAGDSNTPFRTRGDCCSFGLCHKQCSRLAKGCPKAIAPGRNSCCWGGPASTW
jgi:hypothetical protein